MYQTYNFMHRFPEARIHAVSAVFSRPHVRETGWFERRPPFIFLFFFFVPLSCRQSLPRLTLPPVLQEAAESNDFCSNMSSSQARINCSCTRQSGVKDAAPGRTTGLHVRICRTLIGKNLPANMPMPVDTLQPPTWHE